MIIFDSENFELEYHPRFNLLELRWSGTVEIKNWEELIPQLISAANDYEIENILLDASYVDVEKSLSTIQEVPLHHYFKGVRIIPTLRKIARVISGSSTYDETVKKQYTALIPSTVNLEFKNFKHHYEAMYWITGNPT